MFANARQIDSISLRAPELRVIMNARQRAWSGDDLETTRDDHAVFAQPSLARVVHGEDDLLVEAVVPHRLSDDHIDFFVEIHIERRRVDEHDLLIEFVFDRE